MTNKHEIEVWQILEGKVTQIRMNDRILTLNIDRPTTLDPVQVLNDFVQVYNLEKTTILRKEKVEEPDVVVKQKPVQRYILEEPAITPHVEDADVATRVNNLPIHKSKIVDFYHLVALDPPTTSEMVKWNVSANDVIFKTNDLTNFLYSVYSNITKATAANRQHAYVKYMLEEGIIERVGGTINKSRIFKFTTPPFGATTVASFDQNELINRRHLELYTIRKERGGVC